MSIKIKELLNNKLGDYYNHILLGVAILISFSLFKDFSRVNKAENRISEAQQRVENLKEENTKLSLQVKEVDSEQFIEKQIRDNLNLAKDGEIVVVLPDEEVLRKYAPKRMEEKDTLPDPNWKKWADLFI